MNEILSHLLVQLQLDGIPKVAPKAAQFFDQICRQVTNSKSKILSLCRQTIAIQLACEVLSIEFNEAAASSLSGVTPRSYNTCAKEVRTALGLNKSITLEELDVQVGPPPGVVDAARALHSEFKRQISMTIPAAVSRTMNWGDSVYIASVFYVACKYMKKRVIGKAKLLEIASVKLPVLNAAVAKIESLCKTIIKSIEQGDFDVASKAPVRRRRTMTAVTPLNQEESEDENPRKAQPQTSAIQASSRSTARGRRATLGPRQLATVNSAPMDELGLIAPRKRGRPAVQPAESAATEKTYTPAKSVRNRTAQYAVADDELVQSSAAKRAKRSQPATKPAKTKTIAERAVEAVNKNAAAKRDRAAARQPRIGIISMVQDRDYRDTPLYSNYQSWKTSILASQ
ncbi:Origin of replication complex subunit 6 [Coemansia sp. RSA 486]|nr:Origin of replication complex subunit 6 [Coemansia sp. RSA 486]KAJ2233859.1 Origin of replication complex subunit 6 [Coemansia sp. RSA 485]